MSKRIISFFSLFAGISTVLYLFGFIIVNSYLLSLGVKDFTLGRISYFVSSFCYLITSGFWVILFGLLLIVFNNTENINSSTVVISLFKIKVSVASKFVLVFINAIILFMALLLFLYLPGQYLCNSTYGGCNSLIRRIQVVLIENHGWTLLVCQIFCLIVLIISQGRKKLDRPLTTVQQGFNYFILTVAIFLALSYFGSQFYVKIPNNTGGGQPILVTIAFYENVDFRTIRDFTGEASNERNSIFVQLLDVSPQSVLIRDGNNFVSRINMDSIAYIQYTHDDFSISR